jgi:PP-loop superfamily ATP-utilizing enzyme
MRSNSHGGPDTAVLAKLNFDLRCDRVLALKILRPITLRRCNKPARWAACIICCGDVMLCCHKHRCTAVKCKRCKRIWPLPRWSRI